MRNWFFKFGIVIAFLGVIGCSDDDAKTTDETVTIDEAALTAKVDNGIEVISDIVLQGFEGQLQKEKTYKGGWGLPDCVTVSIELTSTSKKMVMDFGTEGCEVRNGHVLKGKMLMSYGLDLEAKTIVIMYSFEDFYVDGTQFVGSKTITRQRENENGNPQYTMEMDVTMIFEDGTQASRIGTKKREWIEGAYNGNWGDNVFEITGAWETNFADGTKNSTTITTPLRREASCRFIVSGVMELVRGERSGTLDYGDGSCDNKAIFTNADGEEKEIIL
ncbi:hypothetical protein ACFSTE_10890 [Aquimarina hainanensis]|uniref:Lipoprotein n=1 Tax=Aquimarina hainanensis TaxID=1578017 RepID=A0ABW5N942_9FLAO